MNSRQLFDAGKLNPAIEALSTELRDNPTDTQRRTFLFELLCFAGNYDRAEKQLDVLAAGGMQAGMGRCFIAARCMPKPLERACSGRRRYQ